MTGITAFEGFTIEQIVTEREINYVIKENGEYVCRLVPGETGFELSPHDLSLDTFVSHKLITQISNFIVCEDD